MSDTTEQSRTASKHDPSLVRRFERTASGAGLDGFLQDRGWYVHPNGKSYRIGRVGEPDGHRNYTHAAYIELLDRERCKAGLEPIVRSSKGKK